MELCEQHRIKKHFTICKTPQQNGVVERINKTIAKKATCFRLNAGLTKNFWVEAVNMEVYFMFLVLDYFGLRVFGCLAYMHIYSNERSKFDAKSRQCIFLGY
jgi:transposase InsO family protein